MAPGTGANIGRPAAGKTGTTTDHVDAWFVGYTPQFTAAVWMGNPLGEVPMTNVNGITVFGATFPAHIWRHFMEDATAPLPVVDFTEPDDTLYRLARPHPTIYCNVMFALTDFTEALAVEDRRRRLAER